MDKFSAVFYFSGCSCGCTPMFRCDVTSDTIDGLVNGLIYLFTGHMVDATLDDANDSDMIYWSSNPFRKCKFVSDYTIDIRHIKEKALELAGLYDKRWDIEKKIQEPFLAPFTARCPQYLLTPEQVKINDNAKEIWKDRKSLLKIELNELCKLIMSTEKKETFELDYD